MCFSSVSKDWGLCGAKGGGSGGGGGDVEFGPPVFKSGFCMVELGWISSWSRGSRFCFEEEGREQSEWDRLRRSLEE